MRVDKLFKFVLPFELWEPRLEASGDTMVTVWVKVRDEFGMLVQGGAGTYLATEKMLPLGSQARSMVDAVGVRIFPESRPMYVVSSEPQFDPFGRIVGWKQRLSDTLPRDFSGLLSDVVNEA